MPEQRKQNAVRGMPPAHLLVLRLCLTIAFLVAGYLLWASAGQGAVAGCGPDSNCDRVLHSRWSRWLGLPVSLFSLVLYALMLGASFGITPGLPPLRRRNAWSVLWTGAFLVLGAAIWFIVVQLLVLKIICPYCLLAHGCAAVAAVLILRNVPVGAPSEKAFAAGAPVLLSTTHAAQLALGASLGLALLILGQVVYTPRMFVVHDTSRVATNLAVASPTNPLLSTNPQIAAARQVATVVTQRSITPTSAVVAPVTGRSFEIYDGQFKFNLDEAPLIGPSSAAHFVVSLFDYTCHQCRETHHHLIELQRLFPTQLAIISLPMPLDPACNHTVTRTNPDHTNACAYARLGFAVTRVDRSKLAAFDAFIFQSPRPPPLDEARAVAERLVGTLRFSAAERDPWVEQMLKQSVAIYDLSYRAGQGTIPQNIIGRRIAVGPMPLDHLLRLVGDQFGLTNAAALK